MRPPSRSICSRHLARVRARYAEIFERVPDLPTIVAIASDQLDFSGSQDVPEATVDPSGRWASPTFRASPRACAGWKAGHVRALRSERARELMEQMLPMILGALAAQPQPDAAFGRFDAFISASARRRSDPLALSAQSRI